MLIGECNKLKIQARDSKAFAQQEWEENGQLKEKVSQLTEKLVEAELVRDEWHENFKKLVKDSFNNSLRQIEYIHPKVDIKTSLCNPRCEVVDGQFYVWVDGKLCLSHLGGLGIVNDDFVGLQIVVLESPDEEMADRFIKTLKTNADDRGVRDSNIETDLEGS